MPERPCVRIWERPHFENCGGRAQAFLICFAEHEPSGNVPFSVERFGAPCVEAVEHADVRRYLRADDPEWFKGWWRDGILAHSARALGATANALRRSCVATTIRIDVEDPQDLGHLQAAWSLVRWCAAEGAAVMLDVLAMRYADATDAAPAIAAEFSIEREIQLFLETEPDPDGWHLLNTRGMAKFARPDLLAWIDPAREERAAEAVRRAAKLLAEGLPPSKVRLPLPSGDGVRLVRCDDASLVESLGVPSAYVVVGERAQALGCMRL